MSHRKHHTIWNINKNHKKVAHKNLLNDLYNKEKIPILKQKKIVKQNIKNEI